MLRVLFVAAFSLMPFAAMAQTPQKLTANGLKSAYYVFNPDRDRMVTKLIIDQGEADNIYAEGLAHYVEHLAWLNALGLKHGDPSRHANASTTATETTYVLSGEQSEFVEMLDKLHRVFLPFEIERTFMEQERDIIMREYDYRVRENVQYPVYVDMTEALYGGTVYGRDVLGRPEDIKNFSIDDAIKLHALSHTFEHASLVIMGNLPFGAVQELVSSQFPMRDGPVESPKRETLRFGVARNRETMALEGQTENELVFQKIVASGKEKASTQVGLELQILEDILESTKDGGMARPLRFDDFIARSFDIDLDQLDDEYFSFNFYAAPDRGVSLDQLLDAFEANFAKIAGAGVSAETFEKMHKRAIDEYAANSQKADEVFSDVPYYLSFDEEPQSYDKFLENLDKVTLDQVNQHLKALNGEGHTEIIYITPKS